MIIMRLFQKMARLQVLAAVMVLLSLLLAGCGTLPQDDDGGKAATNKGSIEPDRFQIGDPITVTFSDTPAPIASMDERVKSDGTITLLYNKTFVAAGKSRGDLEKEIRDTYVPSYFRFLTVSVQAQQRFYYVGGEVRQPARTVYAGPITVLQAIQSCGGFTDFAKKSAVQLTRADGKTFIVNCNKALKNSKLDLPVFPGDTITIPRTIF